MIRETVYDEIFDAQRHFRTVLDSMSRPGKINRFAPLALTPPEGFPRAAAYVGFALLNADVAAHAVAYGAAAELYLRTNTQCRIESGSEADFIFQSGAGEVTAINDAKVGIPTYPESGATVVIAVNHIGKSSSTGGVQLTLEGPGIETREIVFVTGLRTELLAALKAKNAEFPLGVDAMLVSADECIICLPRTTRVTWDTL
jgi:alpha-D-ribose 1-methylphosphonate 5-triphosphate synthase subunit PhnH